MNILIPHHWLQDHLQTEATPEKIQELLSLCGPSVERIYEREGDSVYDIEVTTNRVDAMSVRGVAREAAVILSNAGMPSQLKPLNLSELAYQGERMPLPHIHNQSQLCDRIICVVLEGVTDAASPEVLQRRLRQVDLNPKNLAVDITNAASHELGHPCHAFDYDKIMALGGNIHVVEAEAGWPFVTLDGAEYTTVGGEVVFVNQDGLIIDLPGIMGTLNTAVDQNTTRILLWVESIAPEKIRFTSMTHGIRTVAAQLNERDLDHELGRSVLVQAAQWYQELAGARVASMVYDEVTQKRALPTITVPHTEIERYLGISLPAQQVTDILTQLGCQVETTETNWQVTPPSFRTDLLIPADIVEEVARIYGYNRLPSRILAGEIPTRYPSSTNFEAEELICQTLADLGYQEQITYSLVAEQGDQSALALKNPLTTDKTVLRQSILPSHLEAMATQWGTSDVRGTFELANVYPKQSGNLPDEHLVLAVLDRDLRALRTSLDVLWNRLFISPSDLKYESDNRKKGEYIDSIFESSVISTHNGRVLGRLGWLSNGMAGAELEWREVLAVSKRWPEYRPLPKTAPLLEDWTVSVTEETPIGDIQHALESADPRITSVVLVSQYQKNWTFRVQLMDREKQMSSEQAQLIRSTVQQKLQSLGAAIV